MIAVTGANGFVGAALCKSLRLRGIAVRPIVRSASHCSTDGMSVGDIGVETNWSEVLQGIDCVIHCAARVHVMQDSAEDPLNAFRAVNVAGTLRLAEQAAALGVRRFVFLSSVKVNGEKTVIGAPFFASDIPAPEDAYGISKHEAELGLWEVARQTGMEVVMVRPPLVYGPGVRANFLRLMQLLNTGIPLPLGEINNLRSMVALDNLVDLLIQCSSHPAAPGQVFMVSDDRDVSISDLLRMLATAMGKPARLLAVPSGLLAGFAALVGKTAVINRLIGSLQVDIAHTKSTLQWVPPVSMEHGLEQTVTHYLANS